MTVRKSSGNFLFPSLFLAFTACMAFLPLFFLSMKYDILDQYLPWRYLVGECLSAGMLPLWNPYTHLGYPLHADPQSGAWYPFVWLISLISEYNIYWIHAEYILHAWIGGMGMFLLSRLFTGDRNVSLLAGAAYMLSGFITGNAQHLTWIISAAWIPLLFYYFLRMGLKEGWKDCIRFSFCFFMLLTGGYPAFSIVTAYALFVLGLLMLFVNWRKKEANSLVVAKLLVSVIIIVLISAVMVMSIMESFVIAGRSEGLGRSFAMANPFSPQSLLSFLYPLTALKNTAFFDTDVSMSNGFFGLTLFAGLMLSLFRTKSLTEWLILAGSIFFLLCAMGDYTPVRGILYDYIPFMDLFRMPSLFRLFVIMGFILLAAIALKDIYKRKNDSLVNVFKVLTIVYIVGIILAIIFGDRAGLMPEKYVTWPEKISFSSSFILQGAIGVLSLFILMALAGRRAAAHLLVIDLILMAWFCAPLTMVSHVKLKEANAILQKQPKGFHVPALTPMIENADRTNTFSPFWCNLGIWRKQPIYDGYNNFLTKQYLAYEESPLFRNTLKNPIIYITKEEHASEYGNNFGNIYNDSTWLYLDKKRATASDNSSFVSACRLAWFTPLHIVAVVNLSQPAYLTLQQQYNRNWNAKILDAPVEIQRSNGNNMSVLLPEGSHRVSFTFRDKKIYFALQVTALTILLSLLVLLRLSFIRARRT